MINYQQTTVAGESWIRAKQIVIHNPYAETQSATFLEEKVVNLSDGTVLKNDYSGLSEIFDANNATETFDLLNPETGTVIGSATYQDVYVMLHSLYYHAAIKRDAAQVQA